MDLVAAALPGVFAAFVSTYAAYRFNSRSGRASEGRAIRREAAADLSSPLRDLRSMSRRWGRVDVSQEEVGSAVMAWSEAFDRQRHRLPNQWLHIGRSVRAPLGEVFGGIALADLRPDMAADPLSEPDFEWQDFADDYITHVLDAVVRWGDGQGSRWKLHDFDAWLEATGRREELPA